MLMCVLSHSQLFATPWTLAHQAPLSMGFSRQEYWSWLPFPLPGDLPDPATELASLASPALAGSFFSTKPQKDRYRFPIIFHLGYLQDIDYNSLCYTINPIVYLLYIR